MAIVFTECGGDVCVLWSQCTHVITILPITEYTQALFVQSGWVHDVTLRECRLRFPYCRWPVMLFFWHRQGGEVEEIRLKREWGLPLGNSCSLWVKLPSCARSVWESFPGDGQEKMYTATFWMLSHLCCFSIGQLSYLRACDSHGWGHYVFELFIYSLLKTWKTFEGFLQTLHQHQQSLHSGASSTTDWFIFGGRRSKQYLRIKCRDLYYIWHKHPLRPMDEVLRIWTWTDVYKLQLSLCLRGLCKQLWILLIFSEVRQLVMWTHTAAQQHLSSKLISAC